MNQKYINSQSAPSTPICFVPELSGNKTNKPATSKLYQHPSAEDLKFKKDSKWPYVLCFLIFSALAIAFLYACDAEAQVREQKTQHWQQQFNSGEPVDVQVHVVKLGGAQ
ncbi:TPA: hypothetical protein ACSE38_002978 [Acinetobacter baumannii]|uniref:Uncharacterized protein n=4 Tax=Acinetobacter calcoaceticus/baumannii complex TaxID=909768 RepID=A0A2S5BSP8_ACIBA|nr:MULTISPECIES: hypothetical protein [Acinetobacter]AHX28417.1 hypothetical protein A478_07475 [Acinetobacter baumannii AC12]AHX66034.1 hypothetical protein B856_12275 [Acinetobacter baumannii AC30]KCX89498.1 hypothetical protein J568_3507 [Acinetobacter baumannii 6112]KCZ30311.1 hypothetical protein J812_3054 [Acinetobacter baumannii 25977_9]AHJ92324.1 hypothetical protein U476_04580 [Acinetobacter baumannii PKAB07]